MNRQSHKQESFNLGDPLPLTYLPTNQNKSKPNRFTSLNDLSQGPKASSSHRTFSMPKNANSESNFRIFNRTPSIRRTNQNSIEERIKTKLTQLNQELDEVAHETTDFELIDIKLDEILDLIDDLKSQNGQTVNIQHDNNDTQVDELLKELESAKAKANLQNSKINTASTRLTTKVYKSRYWILMTVFIIALFFTSSVLAADFKYRYCYYFC